MDGIREVVVNPNVAGSSELAPACKTLEVVMPIFLPEEGDPGQWEDPEPSEDCCQLTISRHCTGEAEYLWEGESCCRACLNLAEESREKADARMRLLNEAENLECRR